MRRKVGETAFDRISLQFPIFCSIGSFGIALYRDKVDPSVSLPVTFNTLITSDGGSECQKVVNLKMNLAVSASCLVTCLSLSQYIPKLTRYA